MGTVGVHQQPDLRHRTQQRGIGPGEHLRLTGRQRERLSDEQLKLSVVHAPTLTCSDRLLMAQRYTFIGRERFPLGEVEQAPTPEPKRRGRKPKMEEVPTASSDDETDQTD